MTDFSHLWISAALFTLGARIMDAPGYENGSQGTLSKTAYVEGYGSTILMFAFAGSLGYVWYEISYVRAVVYGSAALLGIIIYDALVAAARRWRTSDAAITVACLIVGPTIAGLSGYQLVVDLTRLAHPHASWRFW